MDTSPRTLQFSTQQQEDCATIVQDILVVLRNYCRKHLGQSDELPTLIQQQKLNICLLAELSEKPLRLTHDFDHDGLYRVVQKALGQIEDKTLQGLVRLALLEYFSRNLGKTYATWLQQQYTRQAA